MLTRALVLSAGLLLLSFGPAAAQGPALAPPQKKRDLTPEDRKAWYAILKWPQECEQAYDTAGVGAESLVFWELEPKKYLVQATCAGGAYNPVLALPCT
ncbi:MAG: hypothetical protein FJ128_03535 [Deltaproteobacteria bacterium]|nr:hypothetical protein [Deltaproteobacteria bacterium]